MVHSQKSEGASLIKKLLSAVKLEQPNNVHIVLQQILSQKIDLDSKDEQGYAALHYAVELNNLTIIELLLGASARVNTTNFYLETPLHIAVIQKNNSEIVKLLLKAGGQLDAEDQDKNIALQCAIKQRNNTETIKLLVPKTSNINHQNRYGDTALHYAALYNNIDNFKLLVANRADLNIRSQQFGDTPLELAFNRIAKNIRWSAIKQHQPEIPITQLIKEQLIKFLEFQGPCIQFLNDTTGNLGKADIKNIFSSLTLSGNNVDEHEQS